MKFENCFVVAVVLMLAACGSSKRLSNENISSYLKPDDFTLSPKYVIWHTDSDSSVVFYNFSSKNLLVKKIGEKNTVFLSIKYQLYASYSNASILDSQTVYINLEPSEEFPMYEGKIKFKCNSTFKGVLRMQINDEYRNKEEVNFYEIDKTTCNSRQNFLVTDSLESPLYKNFIAPNQSFNIIPAGCLKSKQFIVNCYFRSFPLAAPAFRIDAPTVFSTKADSTFSISVDSILSLRLNRYGFYHFISDDNSRNGVTVFLFPEDFPSVTNASQLIDATRYLTTSKEHLNLVQSTNKKVDLDRFWLEKGGTQEQARNLIRIYYQRVQFANHFFSSYMEGWRTDRGMIYIIFGPPQSIYHNDLGENWNYGTVNSIPDLSFTFRKVGNPFTNNDYELVRQPIYENAWYLAVDQWRQGRAFNYN
jgi:GWxTD domain-containing protein